MRNNHRPKPKDRRFLNEHGEPDSMLYEAVLDDWRKAAEDRMHSPHQWPLHVTVIIPQDKQIHVEFISHGQPYKLSIETRYFEQWADVPLDYIQNAKYWERPKWYKPDIYGYLLKLTNSI